MLKVYRLEHRSSALGPFEHRSSRTKRRNRKQDALRYIRSCAKSFMPDLIVRSEIKQNAKHRYGWLSLTSFNQMIVDRSKLDSLGFRLVIYLLDESDTYQSFSCGQIAFVPTPTTPRASFRLTSDSSAVHVYGGHYAIKKDESCKTASL